MLLHWLYIIQFFDQKDIKIFFRSRRLTRPKKPVWWRSLVYSKHTFSYYSVYNVRHLLLGLACSKAEPKLDYFSQFIFVFRHDPEMLSLVLSYTEWKKNYTAKLSETMDIRGPKRGPNKLGPHFLWILETPLQQHNQKPLSVREMY